MPQHARGIEIHKTLSTSMSWGRSTGPQWVSDSQLNYLSQFDFITYNLDQDKLELIERPLPHHPIIAVKYFPLIGHRNVRIVCLCRDPELGLWSFVVLPSLNFGQEYCVKRVTVPGRSISWIENFVYAMDGHCVLFVAGFGDGAVGVVCMGLVGIGCVFCQISEAKEKRDLGVDRPFYYLDENQTDFQAEMEFRDIKNSSLFATKQPNTFILSFLSLSTSQIKILHKLQISDLNPHQQSQSQTQPQPQPQPQTQPQPKPKPEIQIQAQIECGTVLLSKTYLLLRQNPYLHLLYLEQQQIRHASSYNTSSTIREASMKMNCMTCSLHSNKVVVSTEGSPVLYQYRVNDLNDRVEYINCIGLEGEHQYISKAIISDTGRIVAVFSLAPSQAKAKGRGERKRLDIVGFSLFKIELYTQLGIPDSSLCLKQIKYKNRTKRVNRLTMPKTSQKLFSLTGSQVHTLESHRLSGAFSFDIHPYGFYMAISYSFNIKIYSLQASSMTLLYSFTMQGLRKVLYSPDGALLVGVGGRVVRVLDAFSFQGKYEITEKNSNIIDVTFGAKRNTILILHENGIVAQRNFYDFDRVKIYRIYGHTHHQRNQNIYCLLEDGSLILKPMSNLTSPELYLSYPDCQKISQFHIDMKNSLLFTGTKTGLLRIHSLHSEKVKINEYTEIQVTRDEITAIMCSFLEEFVYVGNAIGDVTELRYGVGEGLGLGLGAVGRTVAPRVGPYFSFNFEMVSLTKFQGNSEQNALQDKLENLIQKMQNHTKKYKNSMISSYQARERECRMHDDQQSKNAYRDYDTKSKRTKMEIYHLREKNGGKRKTLLEEYEEEIRGLFGVQERLQKEKQEVISNWNKVRKIQQMKIDEEQKLQQKEYEQNFERLQLFYRKQKYSATLSDLDNDYRITDANALNTLNTKLSEQLSNLRMKCLELNKSNSYLQTAKVNIQSRKVQQQTLEHRIAQQLTLLAEVKTGQAEKLSTLAHELRLTEDLIHHIQNKVKNTPNNVISTDKADSDLCSYKLWMKEKVQEELGQLEDYLRGLEENFQSKSGEIVRLADRSRGMEESSGKLKAKEEHLKNQLKNKRYQQVLLEAKNTKLQKKIQPSLLQTMKLRINQPQCYFDANKAKKIVSLQKLNDKALFFQNKNLKIHTRKIRNLNTNNAELLHEYEKLKYENKWLLDKQLQYERSLNQLKGLKLAKQQQKKETFRATNSERTSLHKDKQTPFLQYVRLRACKTKKSLNILDSATFTASTRARTTMRSAATSRIF